MGEFPQYTEEQQRQIIAIAKLIMPLLTEGNNPQFYPMLTNTIHYPHPATEWGLQCSNGNQFSICSLLTKIFPENIAHFTEWEFTRVDHKEVKRPRNLITEGWSAKDELNVYYEFAFIHKNGFDKVKYFVNRIKAVFGIVI